MSSILNDMMKNHHHGVMDNIDLLVSLKTAGCVGAAAPNNFNLMSAFKEAAEAAAAAAHEPPTSDASPCEVARDASLLGDEADNTFIRAEDLHKVLGIEYLEEEDVMSNKEIVPTNEPFGPGDKVTPPPAYLSTYPLKYNWTFWAIDSDKDWTDALSEVTDVGSVQEFWRVFCHQVQPPSDQASSVSYCLFKKGIRPEWEHPRNAQGGRWNICHGLTEQLADGVWLELLLLLVGNAELEAAGNGAADAVCGLYATRKQSGQHRMSVWLTTTDKAVVMAVGYAIQDTLCQHVGAQFQLEFTESRPANGAISGRKPALYQLQ